MPFTPHVDFLTGFAKRHFTSDASRNKMLRLKLHHTLRVFDNAKKITKGEQLDSSVASMARLAALYHDIGRFPQFAQYATFNDKESVNHGRLGVLTLRSQKLPGDLPPQTWRIIRGAVRLHNVRALPPNLREPLATVSKVVRDADKIDILKVMINHFSGENTDPAIIHGHQEIPDHYTESVYNDVMAEKSGDYSKITCANDFKLLIIGWIYDINFRTGLELIRQRNLLEAVFSFLPKDEKIQALAKKVNKFMHYKACCPS